jgi:hypothetical protein
LNFANSQSDANYAATGTGEWTSGVTSISAIAGKNSTNTTLAATLQSYNTSSSPLDCPFLSANVFGN